MADRKERERTFQDFICMYYAGLVTVSFLVCFGIKNDKNLSKISKRNHILYFSFPREILFVLQILSGGSFSDSHDRNT